MSGRSVQAVLFDLDGTLVDSAPDLAGAANDLRLERGLEPLPFERLRPMVGAGARGMVGVAFGTRPGDEGYDILRERFLVIYAGRLLQATTVFEGVWPVIETLESRGIAWGIVTNKAHHLAHAVSSGLGLHPRAAVLIGGDTTPYAKPHPEPLREASRRIGCDPAACLYVGDDLRDMQAARAAGMGALAALWGYLGEGDPPSEWGADHLLTDPGALLAHLPTPA